MSFLLDTNVLSEVRKPRPNRAVASWFRSVAGIDLYVSVLAVGEIRQGIERLRPRDSSQATVFERWLEMLKSDFSDRILPVSAHVAEIWGRMNAGRPLPIDSLVAATALAHGLTLVTRDAAALDGTGVDLLDPWCAQ